MKHYRMTNVTIFAALIAAASIAGARQGDVQAQTADDAGRCSTGNGNNALTIALPKEAVNHIDGVYIRRMGCNQWSPNFGVLVPGKSLHILNLGDGELEVFWRECPHAYGEQPEFIDDPPTADEWNTVRTKRRITLSDETHRRIVVSE